MIAAVRGTVLEKARDKVYIESSGGVVYEMAVSQRTASELAQGALVLVYTCLIVRENEMYLTGFLSLGEKNLFEILITAKGIGPKQGLRILDALNPAELRLAIVSGDSAALARIKGVGAKKAEQLILDLKGKMQLDGTEPLPEGSQSRKKVEVLLTMRALGYTDGEIKRPLDIFFENAPPEESVEQLVTRFLRTLNSR